MSTPLPLTSMDEYALESYEARFGVMTSDAAFQEALYYDGVLKDLVPGDSARTRFTQERNASLAYSALLEKRELQASAA